MVYMKMISKNFDGKKVLVLGLGVSGRSASRFLLNAGAQVVGVDRDAGLIEENAEIALLRHRAMTILHENTPCFLEGIELMIVSPGVPPTNPWYRTAVENGLEIIGEIELACRCLTQPFIGITGTNGKTTVSLLVGHVLNHCGKKAKVLGNVGVPLTSEITGCDDWIIVCELSSYQLESMRTPIIDAGAILNITPDHLDRYKDMEEYAAAKFKMAECIKPQGSLYIEQECFENYRNLLQGTQAKTYGYSPFCDVFTDLKMIFYQGKCEFQLPPSYQTKQSHDLENLMAAFALCCELGVEPKAFGQALSTFRKPPHRIEFVRKMRGIAYYDDSKGTNIDAVIRAVEAMTGPVILIAGGLDKGASYAPWIEAFADKVKAIRVIGQAKDKIQSELSQHFNIKACQTLDEAVLSASAIAQEGDNVLLSPGCASFDMFRDYAHRGDEFKRIVNQIGGEY